MTDEFINRDFTVEKAPTIPAGAYSARLDGITEIEANFDGKKTTKLRWHWTVPDKHPSGGDFGLSTFSALHLTDSPKSNFRQFVTALRGGTPPAVGESVNARELYGRWATLQVELKDDRNVVTGVSPAAQPAPNGAAQPGVVTSSVTADPEYIAHLKRQLAEAQAAAAQANVESDPARLPPAPAQPPAPETA